MWRTNLKALLAIAAGGLIFVGSGTALGKSTTSGATLQASKTIDICSVGDPLTATTWRYSGEVSVWNDGVTDTTGLKIVDCIQNKGNGPNFTNQYCSVLTDGGVVTIPGFTAEVDATTFPYSFDQPPLIGTIRNDALVTITNHSAHIGTPYGPEPKATYFGAIPPPSCVDENNKGCTLTQGYWKTHNNDVCVADLTSPLCVIWPIPYTPDAAFFISGQSWLDVLNTTPGGNGYYILAHQYIAAVINQANGAFVPVSIQIILDSATNFFTNNAPSACSTNGSCGAQKTAAGILDDYNNGVYPEGPPHCDNPEDPLP